MKKNTILIIMFVCSIVMAGCSKNESDPDPADLVTDVYMAGYATVAGKTVASYWKNGAEVRLSDGTGNEQAVAIAVAGDDVYVAGIEIAVTGLNKAKYWKNGQPVYLTDGTRYASVSSIATSGNDVYISGFEANASDRFIAKYWKNGVAVNLSDGNVGALTRAIVVSGGNVYVAGIEDNVPALNMLYWKNGTSVPVATITGNKIIDYNAVALAVSGNDVYVANYQRSSTGRYTANYWKNGVQTALTDGTESAFPRAIAVSGQDVYVVGKDHVDVNTAQAKAVMWKNGQATDLFNQYSNTDRRRVFRSIRAGADFFVDNRNTISITQQVGGGQFRYDETQDQDYLQVDKTPIYFGNRNSVGKTIFRRYATILNYKHSFPQTGKELTADINYNYGNRKEKSSVLNTYAKPDGSIYQPNSIVNNAGGNDNDQVTFQVDYVNPVSESKKFEAGIRSYHNFFSSLLDVYALTTGTPEKLPLSNNYKYREMVNAAYATYSNKVGAFTYQLGLRAEYSKFKGELIDSSFKFGYEYPANFGKIWNAIFPSLFVTRQLNESTQLQFNYSKRIRRPDFWQLNPTVDVNDPANLRQGNINLRPEFISSFELNLSKDYKHGNVLAVLYFRSNPDDITQYSDTISAAQYQQLQNAAIDPNAILNTFINANTTNRYGAEFTVQHKAGTNFTITPTVNLQYRTVSANVTGQDLSNEGFNWDAKLIGEYKVTPLHKNIFTDMSFQLLGEYESAEVIPQGKNKSEYSVDLAMRKDFLKAKKGTITLGVNDLFNTNRWGTIYDTDDFYQDSYRRWNVRSVRLTFSYKFGDADFSLTNKTKRNEGGGE
ncbi:MAG: TonB-dependent receptor [Chitinophagaceae bacterium]|nr:MAG: TonB-dependent receptor [Chitinophagaceae bacterium]